MPECKGIYEFKEFTLDVKEEDLERDIMDFKRLDAWVKRGLEVSDASLNRTMNI